MPVVVSSVLVVLRCVLYVWINVVSVFGIVGIFGSGHSHIHTLTRSYEEIQAVDFGFWVMKRRRLCGTSKQQIATLCCNAQCRTMNRHVLASM